MFEFEISDPSLDCDGCLLLFYSDSGVYFLSGFSSSPDSLDGDCGFSSLEKGGGEEGVGIRCDAFLC